MSCEEILTAVIMAVVSLVMLGCMIAGIMYFINYGEKHDEQN